MNEWIDLKAEIGLAQASEDSKTWDKECNTLLLYYTLYIILSTYYIQIGTLKQHQKQKRSKWQNCKVKGIKEKNWEWKSLHYHFSNILL